jgi:hypothetical protein
VLVAGLGLELGSGAAVGGQVLEGRVAQLVQGPARVSNRAFPESQVLPDLAAVVVDRPA